MTIDRWEILQAIHSVRVGLKEAYDTSDRDERLTKRDTLEMIDGAFKALHDKIYEANPAFNYPLARLEGLCGPYVVGLLERHKPPHRPMLWNPKTLGDLTEFEASDLLEIKGIGSATVQNIVEALASFGLRFAPTWRQRMQTL